MGNSLLSALDFLEKLFLPLFFTYNYNVVRQFLFVSLVGTTAFKIVSKAHLVDFQEKFLLIV